MALKYKPILILNCKKTKFKLFMLQIITCSSFNDGKDFDIINKATRVISPGIRITH